jgi:pilus assembly protein Flp/PilA
MYVYLWLKNWLEQEEGQDLIEYSLIIALVVIVAVASLSLVGTSISQIWSQVATAVGGAVP